MNKLFPQHVAIIPDGNRRWARKKGLRSWAGHREGARRFKELIEEIDKLGIPCFSFWALSIDNIKNRPRKEIEYLISLFNEYLNKLLKKKEIHKKKIRISFLGSWKKFFPKKACRLMEKMMKATENYNKFFLNLFVVYNGTDELLNAVNQIKKQIIRNPNLKISPELIKKNLLTKDLPPVDYLIRTGGESHLSAGFMMWDIANAQFYFTNTLFPDFGRKEFLKAIKEYRKRERRLGG